MQSSSWILASLTRAARFIDGVSTLGKPRKRPVHGEVNWHRCDGHKERDGRNHAFTRSLSAQLIGRGIRVNAIAPGPVWTPLNPADKEGKDVAEFGSQSPMKRPSQPEEIAPAFVFVAAPCCSSYITGEVPPIIGGHGG